MSVRNVYVLFTRPLPDTLIREAAEKGVTIDVQPFIGTTPLHDERLAKLIEKPLIAIFTSSNAVTAIEGETRPDNWKIFCINGATRRAAADRFGEEAIVATAGSAKELAQTIIARGPRQEVWFFCGDRRREELPESLKAAGWPVHEVVVYQTTLTPHRIVRTYDAIAFFSPSAVESFFSLNDIGPDVPLFAIGPTTAAALQQRCPNPVTVSEQPDEKILIRQIIHRYDQTEK
jgi:uroporphyrinogen-III synthase